MTAQILQLISPFPFIAEGRFYSGFIYKQPGCCRKCATRSCTRSRSEGHQVCEFGISFYSVRVLDEDATITGLVVVGRNHQIGGERRKALRSQWVDAQIIEEFTRRMNDLNGFLKDYAVIRSRDNVGYLHEIRSSTAIVMSCCEKIIRGAAGFTFAEKIENAAPALRDLYGSISLLSEQLELADIIINPSAITFGQRNWSSLHGFLYKIVKLFEPRGQERENRIVLRGRSEVEVLLFNSFQFVPLILLDNAVKYSYRGREIAVSINEKRDYVEVRVSSYGDVVPADFTEKIFNQYVRGPGAERSNSNGMGLGLFLARQIVEAHDFRLYYKSTKGDCEVGKNDLCLRYRNRRSDNESMILADETGAKGASVRLCSTKVKASRTAGND